MNDDAVTAYQQARTHDRAGEEAAAIPHYLRALELGLTPADRRGALVGLGSSLRNVGRLDDSIRILRDAAREFSDDAALPSFLALSLYSAGQPREAVQVLLDVAIRHAPIAPYSRALTAYRDRLARQRVRKTRSAVASRR